MRTQLTFVIPVALLATGLISISAHAQGRGMHRSAGAPRARNSFRIGAADGTRRDGHRHFFSDGGLLFPGYFYADDGIDGQTDAEERPQIVPVAQTVEDAPPPAPTKPVEPLLLEKRNGEWVRVPNGSQTAITPASKQESTHTSGIQSGIVEPAAAVPPTPKLPPAAIVFRDGHTEELGKYMIQGDILYTNTDRWSTGSWTKKIPLADLDIAASLKLNKDRGTKFNLPSGPNEVMIRF
jgi:hypothetical protein